MSAINTVGTALPMQDPQTINAYAAAAMADISADATDSRDAACLKARAQAIGGMTLRDYFATHASHEDVMDAAEVIRTRLIAESGLGILPDGWRTAARYMHADAMLKAREGQA